MLHIIILNKNYFPTKLNAVKPTDKVIILASPDGSIPVSAYKDEFLKNMEVKLLPDIKDTTSVDGRNALRIAQEMLIGQITAPIKDFEIYTDDTVLLKALAPFTGKKVAAKKKTSAKAVEAKAETVLEKDETKASTETAEKKPKKAVAKKTEKTDSKEITKSADEKKESLEKDKPRKSTSKVNRADVKTKPAKLPTQAEVKRVIGAANSSYAKAIMDVIKKSNQITFEMDLRMKLVESGMEANQCKELAHSLNEEFGKMLPASM